MSMIKQVRVPTDAERHRIYLYIEPTLAKIRRFLAGLRCNSVEDDDM